MNYEHYEMKKRERIRYYGVAVIGFAAIGYLFYGSPIASVLLALCAIPAERYYKSYLAQARRQKLAVEFKDMLLSLSASFATGRQMAEAICEARDNLLLVFPADAPINVELEWMVRRLASGGESEREVLFDFANRSRCEDARSFADVYYTCLTTGGDLMKVVNRTASVIVDKMEIRRELETLTAQKKYEAKILTAMPILIVLFLRLNSPDYLAPLYGNPLGICVMTAALGALVLSFFWTNKIMEIEV
jgi:tight adherence protein B